MNDTTSDMEDRYRSLLMQRSGEARLIMGCAMRDAARAIVEASLREQHPQGPVEMIRKGVFLRFYAHEFDGETSAKILASIEQAARLMSSRPSPEPVSANCNASLIIPTSSQ